MISRFFIDRPIFAAVLSIVITLAGGVSVFNLGLAQFPQVTPPTVQVTCNYPGASAKDVAEAVAAPIEQQVNGVEGMMYMSSQCTNDGQYNLTVTFQHGVDLNMAQVLVQNRVSLAVPMLPDVIKQTGVTTLKRSPDILCGIALDLARRALRPALPQQLCHAADQGRAGARRRRRRRLPVRPARLQHARLGRSAQTGLARPDGLRRRRRRPRAEHAGGRGRDRPAALPSPGKSRRSRSRTLGRLTDAEQFGDIILKATPDGRITRLKDVGRVELGAKNEDVSVRIDGQETVFLAIFQMPDANALDTHDRVMAKMDELKKTFPEGLTYDIGFDTTPYTRESIREVFKTLRDAIILVAVVVLLFLQNWRSAIIPLVAVPVAIVGTFAAMCCSASV